MRLQVNVLTLTDFGGSLRIPRRFKGFSAPPGQNPRIRSDFGLWGHTVTRNVGLRLSFGARAYCVPPIRSGSLETAMGQVQMRMVGEALRQNALGLSSQRIALGWCGLIPILMK